MKTLEILHFQLCYHAVALNGNRRRRIDTGEQAMNEETSRKLQMLLDRQEILDVVHRYCHAVDRFDREMLLSVYHPDAIDDHGLYIGGREGFADWAFAHHEQHQISHHHMVFNHSCELDGDVAHCETYWLFFGENRVKPDTLSVGRYLDRMEKRNGRWAVVNRVCITESVNDLAPTGLPPEFRTLLMSNGPSTRSREDRSYDRPLRARQPG